MLTNELISPIPSISDSRREIVRLNEVCKYYGQDDTLVKALDNVSFVIKQGEYCAIMGVSGSGKSTCMNIIGCLDSTTSGQYFLDEEDVSDMEEKDLAKVRNLKIGFVFQQYHLLPQLTALENVMLPMAYANVRPKEQKERAAAALERVAMGHRLNNRPNQMSGGQQQRVAIARALVNNPVMLLADEPTGALDSHTTAEVIELFGKLNDSGITVVMVTHEADVARNTQRIIWFRDGQIINDRLSPNDLNHVI
ncbi:MAG: ABC transporter ATP-binding protein [Pseudanabaena sp. M176S2SP2A07QC]|nr:ABC transporter ATP-binding protein [Pseudanabaena sp. M176S2SP2A07QC]